MMDCKYSVDPELEKCLPQLNEETYEAIKDSISSQGYDKAFPIVVWKDHSLIVDGHHRYRICQELGVKPAVVEHEFESLDDAILYALDHQDNRRNQTPTQKALNAVKRRLVQERIDARKRQLSGLKYVSEGSTIVDAQGRQRGRTANKIAEYAGVSARLVTRIIAVLNKGVPELEGMMKNNQLEARSAETFVQYTPIEEQSEIIKGGVKAIRNQVRLIRKARREEKEEKKFQEELAKEKRDIKEYKKVLKEQFGGEKYSCSLSSVHEMWCCSCKCAFDIFKPFMAKYCPICAGKRIEAREAGWYPGKEV